jgi:hypothetical protein
MTWNPLSFDRQSYLEHAESFEHQSFDCGAEEESEFNEDIRDIAIELAYLRYYYAREEKTIEALQEKLASYEAVVEAAKKFLPVWQKWVDANGTLERGENYLWNTKAIYDLADATRYALKEVAG